MILEYWDYMFGIVAFIGGLYGFLLAFKIYKPKHKKESDKERMDNWHLKFGKMMKVLSPILILIVIYYLTIGNTFPEEQSNIDWTESDKQQLTRECLNGTSNPFDEKVISYCNYVTDDVTRTLTKQEYIKLTQLTEEERILKIEELVQNCLTEFQSKGS